MSAPRGLSAPAGVSAPRGMSAPGECLLLVGVCSGGVCSWGVSASGVLLPGGCGLLLWPSVMAFWFGCLLVGGLLIEGGLLV